MNTNRPVGHDLGCLLNGARMTLAALIGVVWMAFESLRSPGPIEPRA